MSAQDAERCGLVSKVFPVEELVNEAVKLGEKVSGMSKVAVAMAKEAVNAADNLPLNEGTLATYQYYYFQALEAAGLVKTFRAWELRQNYSPKNYHFYLTAR